MVDFLIFFSNSCRVFPISNEHRGLALLNSKKEGGFSVEFALIVQSKSIPGPIRIGYVQNVCFLRVDESNFWSFAIRARKLKLKLSFRENSIEVQLNRTNLVELQMSFNVGTAKIYEVFGLAGKIAWMDLHMDKEGRSKVRSFASSDNEIS